jgi:hypothetical protein
MSNEQNLTERGLLSFKALIEDIDPREREADLEKQFAVLIGDKLNYIEAFGKTSVNVANIMSRQAAYWIKSLNESELDQLLVFGNLEKNARHFINFVIAKKPEVVQESQNENFLGEVSLMLAMKLYDLKAEYMKRGRAFISSYGRDFAAARATRKNERAGFHEAIGHAFKVCGVPEKLTEEFRAALDEYLRGWFQSALSGGTGIAALAEGEARS